MDRSLTSASAAKKVDRLRAESHISKICRRLESGHSWKRSDPGIGAAGPETSRLCWEKRRGPSGKSPPEEERDIQANLATRSESWRGPVAGRGEGVGASLLPSRCHRSRNYRRQQKAIANPPPRFSTASGAAGGPIRHRSRALRYTAAAGYYSTPAGK